MTRRRCDVNVDGLRPTGVLFGPPPHSSRFLQAPSATSLQRVLRTQPADVDVKRPLNHIKSSALPRPAFAQRAQCKADDAKLLAWLAGNRTALFLRADPRQSSRRPLFARVTYADHTAACSLASHEICTSLAPLGQTRQPIATLLHHICPCCATISDKGMMNNDTPHHDHTTEPSGS